jgi:hypothetical protein
MRAAVLLSVLIGICALAAGFGIPAVYVAGQPVLGLKGLAIGLFGAAIPPAAVLAWRSILSSRSRNRG